MFVRQIPEFHLFRVTDIQIGLLAERNTSAVSRVIEKQRYQCCCNKHSIDYFFGQFVLTKLNFLPV